MAVHPETSSAGQESLEELRELAQQLRVDSIRCSTAAGSGHPTSRMSAADLFAVLISATCTTTGPKPKEPNNDHLIFSKGHASPLSTRSLRPWARLPTLK